MFQKILDKTDLIMYIKNRNNKQSITTETTMDNNTNNKFNKFNNHIKNVLCYLAIYGNDCGFLLQTTHIVNC